MQRVPVMQSASPTQVRVQRLTPPTDITWHESGDPQSFGPLQMSSNPLLLPPLAAEPTLEPVELTELPMAPLPVVTLALEASPDSHCESTLQT